MRETAATAKGVKRGCRPHAEPAIGTKSRALFDAFVASPGIPIKMSLIRAQHNIAANDFGAMLRALCDFYELDLRRIRNGTWVLAGRWDGQKYTDYIAPIVNKRPPPPSRLN